MRYVLPIVVAALLPCAGPPTVASAACQANWIGDGYCDVGCNDAASDWDGGDCCAGTCTPGRPYPCGVNGYGCLQPDVCGNGILDAGEICDDDNRVPNDGCFECAPQGCTVAPRPSCTTASQAQLSYSEKAPGKEQLKLQWKRVETPTSQAGFGDPVGGSTEVALCLYADDGTRVADFIVDRAGDLCAGKPCWSAKRTTGFGYKDKGAAADGIGTIAFTGGLAGKGKASAAGKNNAAKGLVGLPMGLVTALSGNTQPTMQLVTSAGLCIGATLSEVVRDDGARYGARKK